MEAIAQTHLVIIAAIVFGAVFGSFACCQAWRLRYYIQKQDDLGERSVCMYCRHQIAWYDNIPIISWLVLKNRCRYCHHRIGWVEFVSEVGGALTGLIVALVYVLPLVQEWQAGTIEPLTLVLSILRVIITVVLLVAMGVLAVYDGKWGELPTRLLILAIIASFLILGLSAETTILETGTLSVNYLLNIVGSIIVLPGVCFILYKASHETLMGGGDWMLALAIALVLGDWWLALWVMAGANILGVLTVAPIAVVKRHAAIHFGPFLVAAFVLVLATQDLLGALI